MKFLAIAVACVPSLLAVSASWHLATIDFYWWWVFLVGACAMSPSFKFVEPQPEDTQHE